MYAVSDNAAHHRYELQTEAGLAFINYRRVARVVTMTHAEVPPVLQGHGIGAALVKGALELVRAQKEKVIPQCPFVATYITRHKEFQELLAE